MFVFVEFQFPNRFKDLGPSWRLKDLEVKILFEKKRVYQRPWKSFLRAFLEFYWQLSLQSWPLPPARRDFVCPRQRSLLL